MRNIGRRSLLISVVLLGAVFAIHGIAPGAAQTEIQLFRGFNEIVWSEGSVEVADGLASIGGRYTAVFRWNNAGQRWDTFAPQLPSALQGFSQLERGRAYWIAMTESGTLVPGREVDPAPGAVSTFGDGTFVVGADIRPGRYRAVDLGAFCSWSRLSGFSGGFDDIIAIEIPQGASALVDIRPTDVGFESSGCGPWSSDLAAVTAGSTAPFGDGTYLVGVDVAPGTWRAPGGEFCTWQRLAGFSGDFGELIAIDIVTGPAIVSIAATDIGFSTTGCGSWTRG